MRQPSRSRIEAVQSGSLSHRTGRSHPRTRISSRALVPQGRNATRRMAERSMRRSPRRIVEESHESPGPGDSAVDAAANGRMPNAGIMRESPIRASH